MLAHQCWFWLLGHPELTSKSGPSLSCVSCPRSALLQTEYPWFLQPLHPSPDCPRPCVSLAYACPQWELAAIPGVARSVQKHLGPSPPHPTTAYKTPRHLPPACLWAFFSYHPSACLLPSSLRTLHLLLFYSQDLKQGLAWGVTIVRWIPNIEL